MIIKIEIDGKLRKIRQINRNTNRLYKSICIFYVKYLVDILETI